MTAINTTNEVYAGTQADLERDGRLLTKVGSLPVVVFWLVPLTFVWLLALELAPA